MEVFFLVLMQRLKTDVHVNMEISTKNCLSMYLCDETWIGFENPNEYNGTCMDKLCDTILLNPMRDCQYWCLIVVDLRWCIGFSWVL